MKMGELREAFAAWKIGEPLTNAYDLMELLTDPTPISEEGLRELGFEYDPNEPLPIWRMGGVDAGLDSGRCGVLGQRVSALAEGMGNLRLLLLSVGE